MIVSATPPLEADRSETVANADNWLPAALTRLIERYDCGSIDAQSLQSSNRYALATVFKSCRDAIDTETDRPLLQTLANELSEELATLEGRVDSLLPSTKEIEPTAQSPVTLRGGAAFQSRSELTALVGINLTSMTGLEDLSFAIKDQDIQSAVSPQTQQQRSEENCPHLLPCISDDVHSTIIYDWALRAPAPVSARLQYSLPPSWTQEETVGVNAEATLGQWGIFGQYQLPIAQEGTETATRKQQHWLAGVGIQNFLIPDTVLAITASRSSLATNVNQPATDLAAFYRFSINKRFTITPTVRLTTDPLNPNRGRTLEGQIRATFSF